MFYWCLQSITVQLSTNEDQDSKRCQGRHQAFKYPVYFTFEDHGVEAIFADIKSNDATGQPTTTTTGGYKLLASVLESKKIASPSIANIKAPVSVHIAIAF